MYESEKGCFILVCKLDLEYAHLWFRSCPFRTLAMRILHNSNFLVLSNLWFITINLYSIFMIFSQKTLDKFCCWNTTSFLALIMPSLCPRNLSSLLDCKSLFWVAIFLKMSSLLIVYMDISVNIFTTTCHWL